MPALRSVNKVILVGNLTRDGEVNFTPSGTPVCSFTVATNSAWRSATGEQREEASFHRVNAWGKFGENIAKILKKGMKVYVEGELTYREQRDAAGKLISKDAQIRAESVTILDRPTSGNASVSHEEFAASQGSSDSKSGSEESGFDLDAISQGLEDAKPSAKKASKEEAAPISDDELPF